MMIIGFLATAVIVLYVHFGLAGFCALIFFITLLCMREVLCETNKKVWFLAVFLAIMLFVASEAVLFLSFFWASIHFIASPFYSLGINLFFPDASELTYGNSLLLSSAAIVLGSLYCFKEKFFIFGSYYSSFFLGLTFISLQVKEFRNLGFYVSDSLYGCVFFFLSGLHFFHVFLGIIILGFFSTFPEAFGGANFHFLGISQDLYFTIQIIYWHFLELVWLFIILLLHSP